MALSASQQAAMRLNAIDKAYRVKRDSAHVRFNQAFDAAMRRHNITLQTDSRGVASLLDVVNFPAAFHNDEEFLAAREAFLVEARAAHSEKEAAARTLPYARVRFQRMTK